MAKLRLNLTYEKPSLLNVPITRNIQRCVEAALDAEGVTALCEINILITDDIGIQGINKAARNIDRPTDVLSSPCSSWNPAIRPLTGRIIRIPAPMPSPWGIWSSPWSGPEPRPRSSATVSSGRLGI